MLLLTPFCPEPRTEAGSALHSSELRLLPMELAAGEEGAGLTRGRAGAAARAPRPVDGDFHRIMVSGAMKVLLQPSACTGTRGHRDTGMAKLSKEDFPLVPRCCPDLGHSLPPDG